MRTFELKVYHCKRICRIAERKRHLQPNRMKSAPVPKQVSGRKSVPKTAQKQWWIIRPTPEWFVKRRSDWRRFDWPERQPTKSEPV